MPVENFCCMCVLCFCFVYCVLCFLFCLLCFCFLRCVLHIVSVLSIVISFCVSAFRFSYWLVCCSLLSASCFTLMGHCITDGLFYFLTSIDLWSTVFICNSKELMLLKTNHLFPRDSISTVVLHAFFFM